MRLIKGYILELQVFGRRNNKMMRLIIKERLEKQNVIVDKKDNTY